MRTNRLFWNFIIVLILLCNVGCDQLSKNLVRSQIEFYQQINFLDNRVMLTRVENAGAFLSIGESLSAGVKFLILIIIPVIALSAATCLMFTWHSLSRSTVIALSFIIGGGIGNIWDRYAYGSVTDFLHVDLGILRTGIFNMADVSIITGVLIIICTALIRRSLPIGNLNHESIA